MAGAQHGAQLNHEPDELRILGDRQVARIGQTNVEAFGDPPRLDPQHVDMARQVDGLVYGMGDEHDGLAGALPDLQQRLAHRIAGNGVERAERLVHQQHRRIER